MSGAVKKFWGFVGTFLLVISPSGAAADITFIGGGYAQNCSVAAHSIGSVNRLEVTGSRLGIPPVEMCTLAITEGGLSGNDLAASYVNRGVLYFARGSLESALADFDQAVRIAPRMGDAHVNRGYTLVAMQRWADSVAAFDAGIPLDPPEPAKAHFNRAVAHEELGNLAAAYSDYKLAAELAPEWDEPKLELERFIVP
jgi:tetratricopeptide (TPR) repeat protein